MNNLLCFLPISIFGINPYKNTEKESIWQNQRIKQYTTGIETFFKYYDILKKNNVKVFIFDNTLESKDKIPDEILSVIPEDVTVKVCYANKYGKNKGAGLIDAWTLNIDEIKDFDYLIHFEPRQVLNSFYFIDNFLSDNRNIFTFNTNPHAPKHFNTGLFTIKVEHLIKFINRFPPEKLDISTSIEHLLYWFFKNTDLEFDTLDKMDLFWYPTWGGRHHW